jgi:hypothetical protein
VSPDLNHVTFRPGHLADSISARVGTGITGSAGAVAQRDLGRYYAALRDELARLDLTLNEACLLVDAMNGCVSDDESSISFMWANVADHVDLNDAGQKWEIDDPASFVRRVRGLSYAAKAAVVDACERFWKLSSENWDTDELLQHVGLISIRESKMVS